MGGNETVIGIICEDSRKCFAKQTALDGTMRCTILSGGYPGDKCPFCKPDNRLPTKKEEQKVRMRNRNLAAARLTSAGKENA